MIQQTLAWLTDPASWSGNNGIPAHTLTHLRLSALALAITAILAIPVGALIGHTGRGRWLAINLAGAFRAIPSLGVLFIAVLILLPLVRGAIAYELITLIVLILLAIPPVLAGAYAGVEAVDPAVRDAAHGMGMSSVQVLLRIELPVALPLIFSGLRSAMMQIIATATMAAIVGVGGLGRYLIDGMASRDAGQMAGGALAVAALALLVDLVLSGIQRAVVSPGLQSQTSGAR